MSPFHFFCSLEIWPDGLEKSAAAGVQLMILRPGRGPPRTSQRGASRLSGASGSEQVRCVSRGAVTGPGLASPPESVQAQTPALPPRLQPPLTAKARQTAVSSGPMFWNPPGLPSFSRFLNVHRIPQLHNPVLVQGPTMPPVVQAHPAARDALKIQVTRPSHAQGPQ